MYHKSKKGLMFRCQRNNGVGWLWIS